MAVPSERRKDYRRIPLRIACIWALTFVGFAPKRVVAFGVRSPTSNARLSIPLRMAAGSETDSRRKVVVIGAGWGGLSTAYSLFKANNDPNEKVKFDVTVIDAAPRVGGLVRDGFPSMNGDRIAEAGQHGFWDAYYNIFRLLGKDDLNLNLDKVLTGYAEQGQYSPKGLEAIWPVYRNQQATLPTGLAQALYTKFLNLPPTDLATAAPLVAAFSEFDDSPEAWEKYDQISFRDLCVKLGVSKRCYDEAFEPMILTGLFAPGAECSAAAALGMAYFFVLRSQTAFDVRWCKGNIGSQILDPWVAAMDGSAKPDSDAPPVKFQMSSRVTGFEMSKESGASKKITGVRYKADGEDKNEQLMECDDVVFAVGGAALNAIVRYSPELSKIHSFRRFANLRSLSVLATRIYLDQIVPTAYTANACWGFDAGIGMTMFNIRELHQENFANDDAPGSVLEVDYYHADELLVMSDEDIAAKVKIDLDTILGGACRGTSVVDAAIVRLPNAVNWYFPGSYKSMPSSVKPQDSGNAYFAGDLVHTNHGSWSQEKAFVTGVEAANAIRGRPLDRDIIPLPKDEPHVALGRSAVSAVQSLFGGRTKAPSLVDFIW